MVDKFFRFMRTGKGYCICGKSIENTAYRKLHVVTHIKFLNENGGKQLILEAFGSVDSKTAERYDKAYEKFYMKQAPRFAPKFFDEQLHVLLESKYFKYEVIK